MRITDLSRGLSLLLCLVAITLLPLVIITWLNYEHTRNSTIAEYVESLRAVNESRVMNIRHLLHLRMEQAVMLSSYARSLGDTAFSDPDNIAKIQDYLESHYSTLKEHFPATYEEQTGENAVLRIIVRDAQANIVAHVGAPVNPDVVKLDPQAIEMFRKKNYQVMGFANDFIELSKSYRGLLLFSVGVLSESGEVLGAVTLNVKPEILNRITANRAGLRESGESYIVDNENTMITESRFIDSRAEPITVNTHGVEMARKGETSLGYSYDDYRGIKVFGAMSFFPENELVLLTEIDEAEILTAVNKNFRNNLFITLVIAGITLILALSIARLLNRIVGKIVINERKARLLKTVAVLANTQQDMNKTLDNIVQQLRRSLKWPAASIQVFKAGNSSGSSDIVVSSCSDDRNAVTLPTITQLRELRSASTRVLERHLPVWLSATNPACKDDEQSWVKEQGFGSAVFVPVRASGDSTVAVISLFSDKSLAEDANILDILSQASIDIGNTIRRNLYEIELLRTRYILEKSNRVKQDFLTMISHELRTPMNAIMGGIQLAKKTGTDQLEPPFDVIQSGAVDVMDLINDILLYTEIQAGVLLDHRDTVELAFELEVLRAHYQSLCDEKQLELRWQLDSSVPHYIVIDIDKLRTIISKLLDNAVMYTRNGFVSLRMSMATEGDEKRLTVTVEDSGIGIKESMQEKVFLPFMQREGGMQRRYGGLGVGLTICKELVDFLGGGLSLQSMRKQGTQVDFSLPVDIGVAPETAEFSGIADPSKPILIVEDNRVNQKIMAKMLDKLGYSSLIADHGLHALEILKQHSVSLVLMDLQMPEMDGFSCTEHIRNEATPYRAIPIIAVTANLMDADRDRCMAAGMNEFLKKPVDIFTLKSVLETYFRKSPNP